MIPLSAVWAGPERDEHFEAPPLLLAKTEGSTPFRFALHVGDVGHTLVVGPTGAGKSVLLALIALQFRRLSARRSLPFDRGPLASARRGAGRWAATSPSTSRLRRRTLAVPAAGATSMSPARCALGPAEWIGDSSPAKASRVTPEVKEPLVGTEQPRQRAQATSARSPVSPC